MVEFAQWDSCEFEQDKLDDESQILRNAWYSSTNGAPSILPTKRPTNLKHFRFMTRQRRNWKQHDVMRHFSLDNAIPFKQSMQPNEMQAHATTTTRLSAITIVRTIDGRNYLLWRFMHKMVDDGSGKSAVVDFIQNVITERAQ